MTPPHTELGELIERLTPNDAKVLRALNDVFDDYEGGGFNSFRGIMSRTRMTRRDVRLSCRRLKRKGLARFAIGLWNDDFEVAGSGYGLTPECREILKSRAALGEKADG